MFAPSAKVRAFVVLSERLAVMVEPLRVSAPVLFPAVNVDPAEVASVVLPVDERVVNAAEDAVVAPIAVFSMPPAVIIPTVVKLPSSFIVSWVAPADLISRAVFVPTFVSSSITLLAVPALVIVNDVSVVVSVSVNAISLPSEVVIVFPSSYACWSVTFIALALHSVICCVIASRQSVFTSFPVGVGRLPNCTVLLRTISPVPSGEIVKCSFKPVVISTATPLKVCTAFVVIAPEVNVPVVARLPFSAIVRLEIPPDWIAREMLLVALVSLITKAFAVPALVREKDESVVVSASTKLISRASDVVIVFPESYACWSVTASGFIPHADS